MKNYIIVLSLFFSVLFFSCSKDNIVNPDTNSTGSISLAFDKSTVPPNVTHVKISLIREGYNTIQRMMDLTSDSTAELKIDRLEIGNWFLQVAAFGISGDTLYKGETFVLINENQTTIINLTLNPVSNGKYGSIKIFVTWGAEPIPTMGWNDFGPVMQGGLPFQVNGVLDPNVIYEDGVYKMWYSGINNNAIGYIFYATSTDGINWDKKIEPVLSPSNYLTWTTYSVGTPKVIRLNNGYKMYFTGFSNQNGPWYIGLATSSDGIHWEINSTPIMQGTIGDKYQVVPGDIVVHNDTYYLYYLGRNFPHMKIYLATSTDGINFDTDDNPIVTPTYTWESNSIYQPTVIYDEGKFKMVYIDYDETKYLGYAESVDGRIWEKYISPIFNTYYFKDHWAANIFNINLRKINNEYKIWYGSDIYKIGLLTKN